MLILATAGEAVEHRAPRHPERPERVSAVLEGVDRLHLEDDLQRLEIEPAAMEALRRVHDEEHLQRLRRASETGGGRADPDTYLTARSWEAARRAAGAGVSAIAALREGLGGPAMVVARPPGHHATREAPMGFCLVNSVAVAAAELAASGERVMIVDWDVHHGNGTQDIFWRDPRVLYVSLHQWPLYPGSGAASEVGGEGAEGTTLNVPLPAGATGDVVRLALEEVVAPEAERFAPTWVLVSAGFDAHRADPLADLALSSGDFADLAADVAGLCPSPDRLALFLEGGYDVRALSDSVAATLGRLLGASAAPEGPTSSGPGREAVAAAAQRRRAALDA